MRHEACSSRAIKIEEVLEWQGKENDGHEYGTSY